MGKIINGDCIEAMKAMDAASVDAVCTDPPYALEFMGRGWDRFTPSEFQAWCEAWGREALRVLKPGGHLLAFGGSRTYHRLTCGLEDAGFEIRDCLIWLYGSGFPKSLDVSKAIDKAAGAEREVVGESENFRSGPTSGHRSYHDEWNHERWSMSPDVTAPATPDAIRWAGWGTALKPAHEPVVLARKPLIGTVARNVLTHGTGALNIDGCRVEMHDDDRAVVDSRSGASSQLDDGVIYGEGLGNRTAGERFTSAAAGRWPANVVLDEQAADALDEQTGELGVCGGPKTSTHDSGMFGIGQPGAIYSDRGGASRFFYTAKASRKERTMNGKVENKHPTIKPLKLMEYLVRLITPPGGMVLDPFMGSGSTIIAAVRQGFDAIGVERDEDYYCLAIERIKLAKEF